MKIDAEPGTPIFSMFDGVVSNEHYVTGQQCDFFNYPLTFALLNKAGSP